MTVTDTPAQDGPKSPLDSARDLKHELEGLPRVLDEKASPVQRLLERVSKRVGVRSLLKLAVERDRVQEVLQRVPGQMQLATNQVRLMAELIDDFGAGRYRDISWRSVSVAALAVLYTVSPADVVPDILPLLGRVDDMLVLGIAVRMVRKELERYCKYKGYEPSQYFTLPS